MNSTTGNITNLTGSTVNVAETTTTTLNSTTGNITNLTGSTVNVAETTTTTLNSTTGNITNLTGSTVNVAETTTTRINSTTGNITNLTGTSVNVAATTTTELNSTNGNITTLTGGNVTMWGANLTFANVTTIGAGTTTTATLNTTNGNVTTLTGTSVNVAATTTTELNSTLANITTGNIETINGNVATFVTLNVSSANIAGLALDNVTIYQANITLANIITSNINTINTTNANLTTLVATNFSSGNARVTGGYADNFQIGANTAAGGNFTIANATTINAYTVNTTTLNNTDGNVTTLVATNFSSGNAQVTGGYADNFPIGANTASTGAFTTATITTVDAGTTTTATLNTTAANITGGSAGTLVITNFSSGNAQVSGGYADSFPIGANTAATGAFTTLSATDQSTLANIVAGGIQAQAIGNTNPGTAVFTNLDVTGYANIAGTIWANSGIIVDYLNDVVDIDHAALAITGYNGNGGLYVAGNAWIGQGVVINGTQDAHDTIIRGSTERSLFQVIVADAGYEQVTIGGNIVQANTTPGAKLVVNSTDAMVVPVGTSAQRPGNAGYTDVVGMLRFNTTNGDLEYFDGANWKTTGAVFTIISTRVFSAPSGDPNGNVDGTNTTFTLPYESSTNSVIVSVNGVVQTPTTTYTVTGDQLVFNEAPVLDDEVEARLIQTTSSITSLQDPTGYNYFMPTATGLHMYTGNVSLGGSIDNWTVTVAGDLVSGPGRSLGNISHGIGNVFTKGATISNAANTAVASANTLTTFDTFNKASFRSAKYVVQATGTGGNYQISEVLVIHNDTVASATVYGVVETGSNVGVVSATISGSNVIVQYVAANAGTNVRISKQYMTI